MSCTEATYQMLEQIRETNILAIDTETTGLEWSDRPFAVSIATPTDSYYITDLALLLRMDFTGKFVIFHNAKFDLHMLRRMGVEVKGNIRDISIQERVLNNDFMSLRDYSLENIAKRYGFSKSKAVDEYIKKHDLYAIRKTKYTNESYKVPCFDKVPQEIMEQYAKNDAAITLGIYQRQMGKADKDDLTIFRNEGSLLKATFEMEWHGIKIDYTYTLNALADEVFKLNKAKKKFFEVVGVQYENKKSVLVPIFEAAGDTIPVTEKGNPQLRDEDLEKFTSPAAKIVQEIRYHEKRISTYYTSYLDLVDDFGFIHPNIQQHGTKTGRFSYANPNLQNIPKDEPVENDYTIRGCFVPQPGNIFLSIDYSQQEYRMMLDYADEKRVIREVMEGKDVHQVMADMVGISRKNAKTLNFAVLYGAGPDKIAKMLGITVSEARILRDRFLLAMPNVDRFISQVIQRNKNRGYVINWLGRKLRNKKEFSYASPNHLIQGGCGDVVKKAMVELHEYLHNTRIIMRLQVHDQLVFEGTKEDIALHLPKIKEIMENVYYSKNGMRLTVDVSYSDKSFAERDMKKWAI